MFKEPNDQAKFFIYGALAQNFPFVHVYSKETKEILAINNRFNKKWQA